MDRELRMQKAMQRLHFTVLGAGTVGVCCALSLRRDGHRVTLIDRGQPGSGCSYGNAGMIQVGGCVPIATPGILMQIPRMLLDAHGPLIIRWQHLLGLTPYLLNFLASARPSRVAVIAQALASILRHAVEAYRPLLAAAGAEHLIKESGELYVYRTEEAYRAAQPAHDLRRRHAIRVEELTVGEVRRLEPALSPDFVYGVLIPDTISTVSPHLLTRALADHFVAIGGELVQVEVTDVTLAGKHPTVLTSRGPLYTDQLVLAFGAHSKKWAAKLGSTAPLDTERGYHLMIPVPGVELGRPVVVGDQKFGLSSMIGGLRIAGTAELANLEAPPNYERAHRLLALARAALPDMRAQDAVPWMGHRPSTPDSLPIICRAPKADNTYFAFGHGHAGLTLAAITGRIIADLAAGRLPPVDISAFDIGRFSCGC